MCSSDLRGNVALRAEGVSRLGCGCSQSGETQPQQQCWRLTQAYRAQCQNTPLQEPVVNRCCRVLRVVLMPAIRKRKIVNRDHNIRLLAATTGPVACSRDHDGSRIEDSYHRIELLAYSVPGPGANLLAINKKLH